ncbi:thiamine diphosphokinase [Pseudooceanicola aestuarii]|uniref:thiamine diphosphokinase n=1 Tax=Pseudooceanicola aestuarii TaxID=2697319 RepID=UPI0013D12D3E|nr:thiamine diphosphokinase [Pseudooceanicola aestuarii]
MKIPPILRSDRPVGLVGGSGLNIAELGVIRRNCGPLVAADGGANLLMAHGVVPDAVIGDLDSLDPDVARRIPADRVHHVSEQDSTDFEKCLTRIAAPLVVGTGFLGRRVDHMMAACTALVRHADRPCLLLGGEDQLFHCPPEVALSLETGTRVSLYPLAPVTGRSEGLRWPIDGLAFRPDGRVGTSNVALGGTVRLSMDGPGMLVILPAATLAETALVLAGGGGRWPVPAPR